MSLNRRHLLGLSAGALTAALTGGCGPRKVTASRDTYVLVHGAWHGGWCWRYVRDILEASGHRVFTPTLSGLDGNGVDANIGLQTHIDDIDRLISTENLKGFVLVGHSYGGMVITGIADKHADRIKHLVYLDATIPQDGQSMLTAGPALDAAVIDQAKTMLLSLSADDGMTMQPLPPEAFGIPPSHLDYDWVAQNLKPHPSKSWFDPISLFNSQNLSLPRSYIHCVDPVLQPSSMPYFAAQVKSAEGWSYHELQTGHDAMITAPQAVSDLLLDL